VFKRFRDEASGNLLLCSGNYYSGVIGFLGGYRRTLVSWAQTLGCAHGEHPGFSDLDLECGKITPMGRPTGQILKSGAALWVPENATLTKFPPRHPPAKQMEPLIRSSEGI
jgi:hypothetical protein